MSVERWAALGFGLLLLFAAGLGASTIGTVLPAPITCLVFGGIGLIGSLFLCGGLRNPEGRFRGSPTTDQQARYAKTDDDKAGRRADMRPLGFSLFMGAVGALAAFWFASSVTRNYYLAVGAATVTGLLLGYRASSGLAASRCAHCGRILAAVVTGRELLDQWTEKVTVNETRAIREGAIGGKVIANYDVPVERQIQHVKYREHLVCQCCGHEWRVDRSR